MARRARKGKGKKKGMTGLVLVILGVLVALGLVLKSGLLGEGGKVRSKDATPNFRIADYRQDGSRFASSGNSYVFEGTVESIETIGNDRLVCISIPHNPDERLPLLVLGASKLKVNLTRGDRFLFETSCRTGQTPEGEQVKGILVVKNVETR